MLKQRKAIRVILKDDSVAAALSEEFAALNSTIDDINRRSDHFESLSLIAEKAGFVSDENHAEERVYAWVQECIRALSDDADELEADVQLRQQQQGRTGGRSQDSSERIERFTLVAHHHRRHITKLEKLARLLRVGLLDASRAEDLESGVRDYVEALPLMREGRGAFGTEEGLAESLDSYEDIDELQDNDEEEEAAGEAEAADVGGEGATESSGEAAGAAADATVIAEGGSSTDGAVSSKAVVEEALESPLTRGAAPLGDVSTTGQAAAADAANDHVSSSAVPSAAERLILAQLTGDDGPARPVAIAAAAVPASSPGGLSVASAHAVAPRPPPPVRGATYAAAAAAAASLPAPAPAPPPVPGRGVAAAATRSTSAPAPAPPDILPRDIDVAMEWCPKTFACDSPSCARVHAGLRLCDHAQNTADSHCPRHSERRCWYLHTDQERFVIRDALGTPVTLRKGFPLASNGKTVAGLGTLPPGFTTAPSAATPPEAPPAASNAVAWPRLAAPPAAPVVDEGNTFGGRVLLAAASPSSHTPLAPDAAATAGAPAEPLASSAGPSRAPWDSMVGSLLGAGGGGGGEGSLGLNLLGGGGGEGSLGLGLLGGGGGSGRGEGGLGLQLLGVAPLPPPPLQQQDGGAIGGGVAGGLATPARATSVHSGYGALFGDGGVAGGAASSVDPFGALGLGGGLLQQHTPPPQQQQQQQGLLSDFTSGGLGLAANSASRAGGLGGLLLSPFHVALDDVSGGGDSIATPPYETRGRAGSLSGKSALSSGSAGGGAAVGAAAAAPGAPSPGADGAARCGFFPGVQVGSLLQAQAQHRSPPPQQTPPGGGLGGFSTGGGSPLFSSLDSPAQAFLRANPAVFDWLRSLKAITRLGVLTRGGPVAVDDLSIPFHGPARAAIIMDLARHGFLAEE